MTSYSLIAALHVIAAVGGVGQLSAIGVMARVPETFNAKLMLRLFKAVNGSLVVMLVTGIAMLWMTDWVYEKMWWFRISFLLFLALGAFMGIAQKTLRRSTENATRPIEPAALNKLKTLTMISSITLVLIVFLMEAKPF